MSGVDSRANSEIPGQYPGSISTLCTDLSTHTYHLLKISNLGCHDNHSQSVMWNNLRLKGP